MPPVGFEPTISAGEQQQTYALDCVATGTGNYVTLAIINKEELGGRGREREREGVVVSLSDIVRHTNNL